MTTQIEEAAKLLMMKTHERYDHPSGFSVIRVLGGWIYEFENQHYDNNTYTSTQTYNRIFVPEIQHEATD